MTKKTILSERLVKSKAALAELTLQEVNNAAGFGPNYIYRLWNRDTVEIHTVNRIAKVLACSALDLLEDVEEVPQGKVRALAGVAA